MKSDLLMKDFSLGNLEAWNPQERKLLHHNFLPIKQYLQITDSDYLFLCGRRGSGKSAIALMLEDREEHKYRIAVPGEAAHYGEYINIIEIAHNKCEKGAAIDLAQAIRRLWIWILPVKAMQLMITYHIDKGDNFDDNLKKIQRYFDSLPDEIHVHSSLGHLLAIIFNEAIMILDEKGEAAFRAYLFNLTGTIEYHEAIEAFRKKSRNDKVLLILDTLESYRIFKEYVLNAFKGILDAVIAFGSDPRMDNIYLKFFIPAEIFDSVFGRYPGKIQSRAVFLRWRSADLITMLGRRFLNVLVRTEAISKSKIEEYEKVVKKAYEHHDGRHLRKEFWYNGDFLPKTTSNQLDLNEDCFAYMFRHTQRRPRDIIAQMQSIINFAIERNEFPYISSKSVTDGIHDKRLLEQIVAEALTPYSEALSTYDGKVSMRLSKEARGMFFRRPAVMTGRELRQLSNELYSSAPLADCDPERFVEILLNCGVVGLLEKERNENDPKSIYTTVRFEYIMQGNLAINDRLLYCVHPAMIDLFEMDLPSKYGAIYPLPDRIEDQWLEKEARII